MRLLHGTYEAPRVSAHGFIVCVCVCACTHLHTVSKTIMVKDQLYPFIQVVFKHVYVYVETKS